MNRREFITLLGAGGGVAARGARAAASAAGDRVFACHFGFRLDAPSGSVSAGLEADWLRPAIRPCVGEPYATRSIEATRRAKSLPMTDFLHPWPPPSIRGPFAEAAHEAPYHQRGWQVARRNRARSRPFFCQESRYSYGPPCTLLLRDSSKKSVSHFGFGEIINDRCTNITTRTLSRYLKTESRGTIALRLRTHCRHGNRPSRDLCPQPAQDRHRGDRRVVAV